MMNQYQLNTNRDRRDELLPCACCEIPTSRLHGCADVNCKLAVHSFCGFDVPGTMRGHGHRVFCFHCAKRLNVPMKESVVEEWKKKQNVTQPLQPTLGVASPQMMNQFNLNTNRDRCDELIPCACCEITTSRLHGCADENCKLAVHLFCGFDVPGTTQGYGHRVFCFHCAKRLNVPMKDSVVEEWKKKQPLQLTPVALQQTATPVSIFPLVSVSLPPPTTQALTPITFPPFPGVYQPPGLSRNDVTIISSVSATATALEKRKRVEESEGCDVVEKRIRTDSLNSVMSSRVLEATPMVLLFEFAVRGASRSAPTRKMKKQQIKATSFQNLKSQILDLASPFLKGRTSKKGKNDVEVFPLTKDQEVTMDLFGENVTIKRRQHIETLNSYTEKMARRDTKPCDEDCDRVMITAYVLGPDLSSAEFERAIKSFANDDITDRAGSVAVLQREELIAKLKLFQSTQWTTLFDGNWSIWADAILHNRKNIPVDDAVVLPPPLSVIKFFDRPQVSNGRTSRFNSIQKRTTAGLQVLEGIEADVDIQFERLKRQYEDNERDYKALKRTFLQGTELLRTFLAESASVLEETPITEERVTNMADQVDFQH
jgi:hypothetical protein